MSNPRTIHQMKVLKLIDHTPLVREVILKCLEPQQFQFKAGQFAMLHVPQNEGKPALRAYSIASDEKANDGFSLLFKYVNEGKASQFVWSLKGDETLNFTGPFGKVFFQEPPTEQIVFLNTGTGLSQHYSYLISKKDQYPDLKYRMYFGVRSEKEIYYQPELEALKKELKDFDYHYVLSRPSDQWQGKKGYVQHFLNEVDYQKTATTFYLCGNGGMIKEVKKQLIEVDQFPKEKIWSEAFD